MSELEKIKIKIIKRLSSPSSSLSLDYRVDEAPEDLFDDMARSGEKTLVVKSLRAAIVDVFGCADEESMELSYLFLTRALRLCDVLEAVELKTSVKQILLEDSVDIWGNDRLMVLHELAARALMGLPKKSEDFRFWVDIAMRKQASLAYALHAAIETNLREGLKLFWTLYLPECPIFASVNTSSIEWRVIIDEADENHEGLKVRKCLEETFYEISGLLNDPRKHNIPTPNQITPS